MEELGSCVLLMNKMDLGFVNLVTIRHENWLKVNKGIAKVAKHKTDFGFSAMVKKFHMIIDAVTHCQPRHCGGTPT
jgi:hypothetical protein